MILAATKRAVVDEWDGLFQTLRRSCEIEWAAVHPQFAVSKWLGHSTIVSGKHYANTVPEELFAKASGIEKAAQKAAQQPATNARKESQDEKAESEIPANASVCEGSRQVATNDGSGRQDTN